MKAAVFGILGVFAMYLLGAFANAGFDIALWSSEARVFCAIGMVVAVWIGFMVSALFPAR